MIKVTAVVGLPGSGKTHHAEQIALARPGARHRDSIMGHQIFHEPGPLTIARDVRAGVPCIVNEILLCHPGYRAGFLEFLGLCGVAPDEIEWIFFENDQDQCLRNIEGDRSGQDPRKRRENLEQLVGHYRVPPGHVAIPVWRPEEEAVPYKPD